MVYVFAVLALVGVAWGAGVLHDLPAERKPLANIIVWGIYVQALFTGWLTYQINKKKKSDTPPPAP